MIDFEHMQKKLSGTMPILQQRLKNSPAVNGILKGRITRARILWEDADYEGRIPLGQILNRQNVAESVLRKHL